jgi:hypothetical protein
VSKCLAVIFVFFFFAQSAFGCSCSNSTPIQSTSESYRERAVFTAHVVQLMGRIYTFDGKRMSSLVIAVVNERYWGLPWYWPRIVLLDGRYPCDIAMAAGEDYLVSGRRERYGVLYVASCSRTQPLETAQIDRRTLDGSHCAGPGGTLIGLVTKGRVAFSSANLPIRNATLTFDNQQCDLFTVQSDGNGIYELQHLAPGRYTLDSRYSQTQYATHGSADVSEGICREASVLLRDYDFSGRLVPGLSGVNVKLVRNNVQTEDVTSAQSNRTAGSILAASPTGNICSRSPIRWVGPATISTILALMIGGEPLGSGWLTTSWLALANWISIQKPYLSRQCR